MTDRQRATLGTLAALSVHGLLNADRTDGWWTAGSISVTQGTRITSVRAVLGALVRSGHVERREAWGVARYRLTLPGWVAVLR